MTLALANEDVTVRAYGETAVANYRFVENINGGEVDLHRTYRTTNVWMRRDGRWQIVAAHTAFVLKPTQVAMLSSEKPEGQRN